MTRIPKSWWPSLTKEMICTQEANERHFWDNIPQKVESPGLNKARAQMGSLLRGTLIAMRRRFFLLWRSSVLALLATELSYFFSSDSCHPTRGSDWTTKEKVSIPNNHWKNPHSSNSVNSQKSNHWKIEFQEMIRKSKLTSFRQWKNSKRDSRCDINRHKSQNCNSWKNKMILAILLGHFVEKLVQFILV